MARPPIHIAVQLEIKQYRAMGKTIDQIEEAMILARGDGLVDEGKFPRPGRGSIAKYTKEYDGLSQEKKNLDNAFQWNRLVEYGLPWEAGDYLLGMWQEVRELWAMLSKFGYYRGEERRPSVREAVWWWRVHLAVPEMEVKMNVYGWAEMCVRLELYQDVLGKTADFSGVEAYLAYKPWVDEARLNIYNLALLEGRITYLPDNFEEFGGDVELATRRERQVMRYMAASPGGINPSKPEILPMEHLSRNLAEIVRIGTDSSYAATLMVGKSPEEDEE